MKVIWHVGNFCKIIPFRECRYDVAPKSTDDDEAVRGRIPQSAHPISYHHCVTRCPCSDVNNPPRDSTPHERQGKVACGDFTGDRGKEFASTSCLDGTSIDLDEQEGIVTNDARDRGPDVKDAWTRANTLTTHRKIVDPTWRCECHPREDSIPNLSRLSCDGCYHRHDYRCDYSHRHCCYQQCDSSCINVKGLIKRSFYNTKRKIPVRQVSIVALHVFLTNFMKYRYLRKEIG